MTPDDIREMAQGYEYSGDHFRSDLLRAEVAALRKDAERYRALREQPAGVELWWVGHDRDPGGDAVQCYGEDLDKQLDEYIKRL